MTKHNKVPRAKPAGRFAGERDLLPPDRHWTRNIPGSGGAGTTLQRTRCRNTMRPRMIRGGRAAMPLVLCGRSWRRASLDSSGDSHQRKAGRGDVELQWDKGMSGKASCMEQWWTRWPR
jgi:hypothetical protein